MSVLVRGVAGKGVQGGVLPGCVRFTPEVADGSREAVFLERRRRWRRAVEDWLATGRPDSLVLEPGPEWPAP